MSTTWRYKQKGTCSGRLGKAKAGTGHKGQGSDLFRPASQQRVSAHTTEKKVWLRQALTVRVTRLQIQNSSCKRGAVP